MLSSPTEAATYAYAYDGDGLLTGRTTGAGTATFTWDLTAATPALLSDGTDDYLYGPGATSLEQADLATGTVEYYVSDDQGPTRALLGASDSVDATFSYDAYWDFTSATGTVTTPLLYGGQYLDQGSGLYYLRARWYDPGTDQFLSVDPDVAETGLPYTYAGDDPVNEADPDGLDAGAVDASDQAYALDPASCGAPAAVVGVFNAGEAPPVPGGAPTREQCMQIEVYLDGLLGTDHNLF